MSTTADRFGIEYPDEAGYPDGTGFLDQGTSALLAETNAAAMHAVDTPSAETDQEIEVHHLDDRHRYSAMLGDLEIASIEYDEEPGSVVVLTTTVDPEFRGRGIAEELIADVLDDIRAHGMRVTAHCPVVAAFLARNPQFADLAN